MIKFWGFIYRLTGWYSPFAKLAEYRHLEKNFDYIEKQFKKKNNDMPLDGHIGLTIGTWQMHNGFYRKVSTKDLPKRAKKRMKK